MINLNSDSFKSKQVKVFNNGEAGKVRNVKVSVEKRQPDEPVNRPPYNVFYEDGTGAKLKQSWFYFKPKEGATEEKLARDQEILIGRLLTLAHSVCGADYQFEEARDINHAVDVIMAAIRENSREALVNIFVTYGNDYRASKYLEVRFFDFIESATTPDSGSRLRVKPNDVMVRLTADDDSSQVNQEVSTTSDPFDSNPF